LLKRAVASLNTSTQRPLVVTGAHLALVLGVVELLSVDRVVRLAPSGVGVLAIALLGPGIVVVSAAAREPR